MKTSGLTEKRMANKHFQKTEHAILVAYYKLKDYPSAKKLAKLAKISRSTLYRHHKRIQAIPTDYEKYLLENYKKTIAKLLRKSANSKIILLRSLVFISSNREVIRFLFQDGKQEIIKKMIDYLRPRVLEEWFLCGEKIDKVYTIYKNEILGVIEDWGQHVFSKKHLSSVMADIAFITRSAHRQLSPLI